MRRVVTASAFVAFVATVYLANWLVRHVGPVRVWPTTLLAPAGVYMIGLAFLLRDTLQRPPRAPDVLWDQSLHARHVLEPDLLVRGHRFHQRVPELLA